MMFERELGDLKFYMSSSGDGLKKSMPKRKSLCFDLMKAIIWLHEKGAYMHRDIKLENLLVRRANGMSGDQLVLADMGSAIR